MIINFITYSFSHPSIPFNPLPILNHIISLNQYLYLECDVTISASYVLMHLSPREESRTSSIPKDDTEVVTSNSFHSSRPLLPSSLTLHCSHPYIMFQPKPPPINVLIQDVSVNGLHFKVYRLLNTDSILYKYIFIVITFLHHTRIITNVGCVI